MRALRDFLLAPPGAATLEHPAGGLAGRGRRERLASRSSAAAFAPSAVAVLCAAEDARAAGVVVAALLARRARAACGVACIWTAPEPHRHPEAGAPASRAARRLAATLAARGLDARPCGRVVAVGLVADPVAALAAAGRATAAAGEAPVVLTLGGPRPAAFDDLLGEQDRLLVVTRPGADPAMGALALGGLPVVGPSSVACPVGLGPAMRALAAAGLAVPAALRRAVDAAIEASR
ncbi:MAG: hypothetical protein QOH72_3047 [Solirubrobacteraceae bacterium]|nr:hypothetical protein [Solirubrobacteraceae bacterium]